LCDWVQTLVPLDGRPRELTTCSIKAWREGNDGVAEFMLQKIMGETFIATMRTLDLELRGYLS
jgi:hypothetical protein